MGGTSHPTPLPFPPLRFLSLPLSFPLSFPFPSALEVAPLNQLAIWGSAVSSSSGVRGRAPAENEFGSFYSCQKATGGNHYEYSEYHA